MTNQYIKRCSILLLIRKMQTKTKMKYITHYPEKLKLDRYFTLSVGEDMEQ